MSKCLVSLCGTVYNNADRIGNAIETLTNAFKGLNYEIVVVDNYSDDGSFEVLNKYARHFPIRVYRYKCSRGLGRMIAFERSKGNYTMAVDLDTEYYPRILRTVLRGYLNSEFRDKKCLFWPSMSSYHHSRGVLLCPRHILYQVGGWRDLTRAEDMDLLARLHLKDLLITLPIESGIDKSFRFSTNYFFRERIYAKNVIHYLKRLFYNSRDMVCGDALTLKKTFITYHYAFQRGLLETFLLCLHNLLFSMICKFSGMYSNSADPILSNDLYVIYKNLTSVVNPIEFGFEQKDIINYEIENFPVLQFLISRYPEIAKSLDKIKTWKYHNES